MEKREVDSFMTALMDMENVSILSRELPNGSVREEIWPVLPGVCLAHNRVRSPRLPYQDKQYPFRFFTFNCCCAGRCEFVQSAQDVRHLRPGSVCLGYKTDINAFSFPLETYDGIEVYLVEEFFTARTRGFFDMFSVSAEALRERYCQDERTFIGSASPAFLEDRDMLLRAMGKGDPGRVRLLVLSLIGSIISEDMFMPFEGRSITLRQADMAKEVMGILRSDLSLRTPLRILAQERGISETGLKNIIREVYGENVSELLNRDRMELASRLLIETDLPVSEIASRCGYANQGRLAKKFSGYFGILPLAYRKSMRERA